jgi:hypothetical protein
MADNSIVEEGRLAQLQEERALASQKQQREETDRTGAGASEQKQEQKISLVSAIFMIGTALAIDASQALLNFIPFVGSFFASIIGIGAWILFFLWFRFRGVKKWKAQGALIGALIVSIIPVLNALPEWTLSVVLAVISANALK